MLIQLTLVLLVAQGIMGAFDTFYNHEIDQRLPQHRWAARELALHSARSFTYMLLFGALAWWEWHGLMALLPLAVVAGEVFFTTWDSIVEDGTRRLTPIERIAHMFLTINVGLYLLALIEVTRSDWWWKPTGVVAVDHGLLSWLLTLSCLGCGAWVLRDGLRAARFARDPAYDPART